MDSWMDGWLKWWGWWWWWWERTRVFESPPWAFSSSAVVLEGMNDGQGQDSTAAVASIFIIPTTLLFLFLYTWELILFGRILAQSNQGEGWKLEPAKNGARSGSSSFSYLHIICYRLLLLFCSTLPWHGMSSCLEVVAVTVPSRPPVSQSVSYNSLLRSRRLRAARLLYYSLIWLYSSIISDDGGGVGYTPPFLNDTPPPPTQPLP